MGLTKLTKPAGLSHELYRMSLILEFESFLNFILSNCFNTSKSDLYAASQLLFYLFSIL